MSFEDSASVLIRDVSVGAAAVPAVAAGAETTPQAAVAEHLTGEWKGSKLVVHRAGPRDSKITETISLEDKGKSLKIDTKIESSGGDMPSREFKRVYTRAT